MNMALLSIIISPSGCFEIYIMVGVLCVLKPCAPMKLPILYIDHVLSCPKKILLSFHNEIRDLTVTLLTEICPQVCAETDHELQPFGNFEEFLLATSNTQEGVLP